MQPTEDSALLQRYVENHSDEAFAGLVTRHINLVYSVALRQVGNPHAAEEITQAVFIILAKKAVQLRHHQALSSWLFQATRLTAGNFIRSETRRHRREEEAYMQSVLDEAGTEVWPRIAPLLDTAVAALREKDRQAIVLRFYEGRNLREVGLALGTSEDAAEKRVNRTLEKLRKIFTKRGVSSTTAIIAGAMTANSVQAAPVALAKSVTAIAITKGVAASSSTLTLIQGALKLMAWAKAKTAIVVSVGILFAAGTITITVKEIQKYRASAWETEYFNTNIASVLNVMPPLVEILPAKFPQSPGWGYNGGVLDQKLVGVGKTLKDMCYEANSTDLPSDRLIFPDDLFSNKYDYVVNLPTGSRQALQVKIAEQFGLVLKVKILETNALLLQVANRNAQGLKLHKENPTMPSWYMAKGTSTFTWDNMSLTKLARFLEMYLAIPVIDRTGLLANFDIKLKLKLAEFPANWKDHNIDDFQPALLNQLGLELVPTNMPIEMLVIEKSR